MTTERDEKPTGIEEAPPEVEPVAAADPDISKIIDEKFGQLQGRMAGVMGQRTADLKREVTEAAVTAVREALAVQAKEQQEQQSYRNQLLQQGLDDEQIAAVMQADAQRRAAQQPAAEPKAAQPAQSFDDGYDWDASERQLLGKSVTALLDGLDLTDVEVSDQRLWNGVSPGISTEQAYQLVKTNARKIKPASRSTEQSNTTQQAAQTKPQNSPPPTTQTAPVSNASSYDSKADAAAAFTRGEINIDEYKVALSNL